jgi:cell envelope opacity-associated protein A|tara:strand:+ start:103 stop:528 length:426 start_codon:yes stop_codon:yes gene_type:complete
MATSDYKNALTNMRNFILGGGYVAGTLSGESINPETGKRRQATEAIMARSPTVGDTKKIQESMELGEEIKALNAIYELQKAKQDLADENVKSYTVRPGDTITDVLERHGMDFAEFSTLNQGVTDLDSGDKIQVVQREVEEA